MQARRSSPAVPLALLLLLTACGGGGSGGVVPDPPPDRTAGAGQERLSGIAADVRLLGRERFPRSYSGVSIDPERSDVTVYRVPDPAFDAVLATELSEPVTIRDSRWSERENDALAARILDEDAYWRSRGLVVTTVGPQADGRVAVGVLDRADRARTLLAQRYGSDRVVVQEEGPVLRRPPVRRWPIR